MRRLALVLVALAPLAAAAAEPDPSYLPELVARARALRLAEDEGWLRLGHYRRTLLGGWKSEADGPAFFRARAGKTDPAAELEATLAGFLDPRAPKDELDDAQCRFPARLAFLEARLGIDPSRLPHRACPRWEQFRERLRPQGATLVFSSYYLNNPASSFGHTLLRLDKAPEALGGKRFELLDYGVNYAATYDTTNPIAYALKGLLGLFKGEFTYHAYYYKVREYADAESRDLWEYDLALAPAEVALLTAHVWELGGTWFDYWYLDENCSYHVLGALEAAAPRLDLLSHVGRFVVLPSETVRALFLNPGLVRAVHYRPSIRTQFEARAARLTAAERAAVEALAADPDAPLPAALGDVGRAETLDAAQDLLDFRHAKEILKAEDEPLLLARQRLLERRSAILVPSPPLEIPIPDGRQPQLGHGALRLGAGGGLSRAEGGQIVIDVRLALHDLVDPPRGYPELAHIEFLPTRVRIAPGPGRVTLDDVSLVKVTSLNPVSRFDARPSWRFRVGATTVRDAGCDRCLAGAAELGAGWATAGLLGHLDLLATGDTELLGAPRLSGAGGSGVRPGLGPTALARVRASDAVALQAEARWRWLPAATPRDTWAVAATLRVHLSQVVSVSLEARRTPEDLDGTAALLGYF